MVQDPELRTTTTGVNVCSFTVAVNRKKTQNNQDPGADYFKVQVWRERGENCAKFLQKGKKVCVTGAVSASAYQGRDGQIHANLEIKAATEVEFLSPRISDGPVPQEPQQEPQRDAQTGYQQFTEEELEDLPF